METQELDFEKYPPDMHKDETDVNLRAYFTRMDDAKLATYDPKLSDEQLIEWFVCVEAMNHVISISPGIGMRGVFIQAVGVRKTDNVKPMPRPTFAVMRRREQLVDRGLRVTDL